MTPARNGPGAGPPAIDEVLRIHPPLIANRRKALRPACIGGREIAPGARLTLMWASANRDEVLEALLSGTRSFTCASAPRRTRYPASGFSHLPIQVMR